MEHKSSQSPGEDDTSPQAGATSRGIFEYTVNPLYKGPESESAVLCTSLHGVFIQIFSSVAETSECFQIDEELVRRLCHGVAKRTLGISLQYATNEELAAALAWKDRHQQGLAAGPCQWHVSEAWKAFQPETKSQTRKRLQKEVHSCVEVTCDEVH